jgi:hypothetical protein
MPNHSPERIEQLKLEWTGRFVRANAEKPELKRFEGRIGRVVTVNCSGKAIVDFADGAWYDIPASSENLVFVTDEEAAGKFDATATSAQARPARQG